MADRVEFFTKFIHFMPKRTDLNSIMLIGAGPIVIGQACEFDYSGTQACKALREEGYRVVLVNSNPATIMTDPDSADATYIEPITAEVIERIIARERPDAILPTMGGQTALNVALELAKQGILVKYGVELIGASPEAIDKAEDRQKFKQAMDEIGLESAHSGVAYSFEDALRIQKEIAQISGGEAYPMVIRPSFTLGGSGGGIAYNQDEFEEICKRGLDLSPTSELLIEESLLGWKEFEMEVIRDKHDNCIIVCSIENLDPIGVHTGDSITVAPIQTLTDKEYQVMRDASIAVLRKIGVDTGGSNVQFALHPKTGRMIVIEMNPRVSRSSALASKATGFPIAKIAAKLAVGFTLDELKNDITNGQTPASFEPTIDYVVTKIPRFAFEKFKDADTRLTTQMKSVGEVMAIGRTFQESFQKALRGLETGVNGLVEHSTDVNEILKKIHSPGPDRIWYLADALRVGLSEERILKETGIDRWFVAQIAEIVEKEEMLRIRSIDSLTVSDFRYYKASGFSDARIAALTGSLEEVVRDKRQQYAVRPVYKRVDTCSAEFETTTAYLYSTYEQECEAAPTANKKIIILGGGPNRIGQGIEFDYCCVHASLALKERGFETIMINCNPETVSTDYDISDRLYFEPLTFEDVLAIVEVEKPIGVIVQYGGQTPLKLATALQEAGVPIIGTSPKKIDEAEDRERFKIFLETIGLRQPSNRIAYTETSALAMAKEIGFPIVVRPSYVLGGRAMEIVSDVTSLKRYIKEAVNVAEDSPILLDRFLTDAIECDVDCISDGKQVYIAGVMQHIEPAGIHSGDSACSLPPYSLNTSTLEEICRQTEILACKLEVVGLMNVQFAIQKKFDQDDNASDIIYVLEVNPRASRTVPFVSKATTLPLAKIAARCMAGESLAEQGINDKVYRKLYYFSVKEAVFPFVKFPAVDPILGPEMRSTGEVMGIGQTFGEAWYKAQLAAGLCFPREGAVLLMLAEKDYLSGLEVAKKLHYLGYKIVSTESFAQKLIMSHIPVKIIDAQKNEKAIAIDMIKSGEIAILIVTSDPTKPKVDNLQYVRISAQAQHIPFYTTIAGALAMLEGMGSLDKFDVEAIQNLKVFSHV